MRSALPVLLFTLAVTGSLHTSVARANPEPIALYDARSVGLGGTGLAFLDGPAATFHNPAGLLGIGRFAGTFAFTPLLVQFHAPFAGPGSERNSGLNFAPLGFLGGALRLHERVVIGAAVYITTGFGGGFDNVDRIDDVDLDMPQDQDVALFVGELAFPIAIRILDNLSVGLSLRIPYARQEVDLNQEATPGNYPRIHQEMHGVGIPGVLFGLRWGITDNVSFGMAYRSKIRIPMEGGTELLAGTPALATSTEWFVPHMVRGGFAFWFAQRRIMLTAEMRVQFHDEANNDQVFSIANGAIERTAPFQWQNVFNYAIGAEFWPNEYLPLRIAASTSNSATPRSTVSPFTTPPTQMYGVYAGFGYHRGPIIFDAGFSWGGGGVTIDEPFSEETCLSDEPIKYGCAGEYRVNSYFIGLSFTYDHPMPDEEEEVAPPTEEEPPVEVMSPEALQILAGRSE